MLFRHEFTPEYMLLPINVASDVTEGVLVEIIVSGKSWTSQVHNMSHNMSHFMYLHHIMYVFPLNVTALSLSLDNSRNFIAKLCCKYSIKLSFFEDLFCFISMSFYVVLCCVWPLISISRFYHANCLLLFLSLFFETKFVPSH